MEFHPPQQRKIMKTELELQKEFIENPELKIDLKLQKISRPNGATISFEIDPFRKECLLNGLDDIGLTLEKSEIIRSYEQKRSSSLPWL